VTATRALIVSVCEEEARRPAPGATRPSLQRGEDGGGSKLTVAAGLTLRATLCDTEKSLFWLFPHHHHIPARLAALRRDGRKPAPGELSLLSSLSVIILFPTFLSFLLHSPLYYIP